MDREMVNTLNLSLPIWKNVYYCDRVFFIFQGLREIEDVLKRPSIAYAFG